VENWYVFIQDGLKSKKIEKANLSILPKEKLNKITQLTKSYKYASPAGFIGLKLIAVLLMIGWAFLIIREFINVCCPDIYQNLFNIICGWYN